MKVLVLISNDNAFHYNFKLKFFMKHLYVVLFINVSTCIIVVCACAMFYGIVLGIVQKIKFEID